MDYIMRRSTPTGRWHIAPATGSWKWVSLCNADTTDTYGVRSIATGDDCATCRRRFEAKIEVSK